ncbi:MAG: pilus assembly protein PilY, partial [Pseudomonas sp.]
EHLLLIAGEDTPTETELADKKGWYLQMRPEEQVVTSAITVFGTVTFSTHEPVPPQAGQCSPNLGRAEVYNISYKNAAPTGDRLLRSEMIPGGGLPPSPVAGMVKLDDGTVVPFIIGGDASSPLAGREPSSVALGSVPKGRVYWNIEE